MDLEAGVRSQHSVQIIAERIKDIEKKVKELLAIQQKTQIDEKMMEAIAAHVGDEMGERIANKVLSLLSSNAGVLSLKL